MERFCMQAALTISTKDPNGSCRAAARELLRSGPISAAVLVPLLALPTEGPLPKRGRSASKSPKDTRHAVAAAAVEGSMALTLAILELLQWRSNVARAEDLVQHLNSLLPALQRMATGQDSTPADTDDEGTDRWTALLAALFRPSIRISIPDVIDFCRHQLFLWRACLRCWEEHGHLPCASAAV